MSIMQDLLEQAKKKIYEDVEFLPAPIEHESDMQQKGILAKYDSNNDIVYYSDTMLKFRNEKIRIQTFIHELAHAKDFRTCVRNGLLKVLEPPSQHIFHVPWKQLDDILHNATEYQMSNYLNSEFGCQLPYNCYVERCLHEPLYLSLIPSIEYLCFGENSHLRAQFGSKLNSGNNELLNKISNIINEEDIIKLDFLEECLWKTIVDIEIKEINNFPFKITISQFKLIEDLSKPPNRHEIRIKATEKLNYIKDLMNKKIIKITQDDYS